MCAVTTWSQHIRPFKLAWMLYNSIHLQLIIVQILKIQLKLWACMLMILLPAVSSSDALTSGLLPNSGCKGKLLMPLGTPTCCCFRCCFLSSLPKASIKANTINIKINSKRGRLLYSYCSSIETLYSLERCSVLLWANSPVHTGHARTYLTGAYVINPTLWSNQRRAFHVND